MKPTQPTIEIHPVSQRLLADWLKLFAPIDGCDGCYCFNHHIAPGSPDCEGTAAKEAKLQRFREGRAGGLLAYVGRQPVAWCALDRRGEILGHDCVDATNGQHWAIHCLLVLPAARGNGIAGRLVDAALRQVEQAGGGRLEAYSQPASPLPGLEFLPPPILFSSRGFQPFDSPDSGYACWAIDLDE